MGLGFSARGGREEGREGIKQEREIEEGVKISLHGNWPHKTPLKNSATDRSLLL